MESAGLGAGGPVKVKVWGAFDLRSTVNCTSEIMFSTAGSSTAIVSPAGMPICQTPLPDAKSVLPATKLIRDVISCLIRADQQRRSVRNQTPKQDGRSGWATGSAPAGRLLCRPG